MQQLCRPFQPAPSTVQAPKPEVVAPKPAGRPKQPAQYISPDVPLAREEFEASIPPAALQEKIISSNNDHINYPGIIYLSLCRGILDDRFE